MAGQEELDKFVRKFVSLWQSGCEASLHVETKAGNAFVNLNVGLGQVKPLTGKGQHGGVHRGGGPAKQRRRERREAEHKSKAAAEKAAAAADAEKSGLLSEKTAVEEAVGLLARKDNKSSDDKIPQIDGAPDAPDESEFVEYALKIAAHEKCKNYDITEAIEVNFDGALDDLKVGEKDPARYIHVQKKKKSEDDQGNLLIYRVCVRDIEVAHKVFENWKQPHMFDDLAFGNAVYGIVRVRIQEIQKL